MDDDIVVPRPPRATAARFPRTSLGTLPDMIRLMVRPGSPMCLELRAKPQSRSPGAGSPEVDRRRSRTVGWRRRERTRLRWTRHDTRASQPGSHSATTPTRYAPGGPTETLHGRSCTTWPRNFRSLGRDEQQHVLNQRPPSTSTRWDALLAATVEHLCELHGQQPSEWLEEPERFLEITWILPTTPTMVTEAIAFAPAAFIRHGVLPDPRCLDARGGERHDWVPGSQPHHETVRDALGQTGRTRDSGPALHRRRQRDDRRLRPGADNP